MKTLTKRETETKLEGKKFFTAECSYFGRIDGSYEIEYKEDDCVIVTNAIGLTIDEAINELHSFITRESFLLDEYPKAKWEVYFRVNGNEKLMYQLSSKQAKIMLF